MCRYFEPPLENVQVILISLWECAGNFQPLWRMCSSFRAGIKLTIELFLKRVLFGECAGRFEQLWRMCRLF